MQDDDGKRDAGRRRREAARRRRSGAGLIASRVFIVLGAAFIVGALAIATASPPDRPLAQLLLAQDPDGIHALHAWMAAHLPGGAWDAVAVPVLERPGWLVPMMMGIVACGLSATLRPRPAAPTRRTR